MEISKNAIAALLVLVFLFSVFSTWVVLDGMGDVRPRQMSTSGAPQASGQVSMTIDGPAPSVGGEAKVRLNIDSQV